jgi:hypothetical protein
MLVTFVLVCLAWVFFRAASVGQAMEILSSIASPSLFTPPGIGVPHHWLWAGVGALVTFLVEWLARERAHGLHLDGLLPRPVRWGVYYAVLAGLAPGRADDRRGVHLLPVLKHASVPPPLCLLHRTLRAGHGRVDVDQP